MMGRPRSDHHEPTVHWVLLGAVMLVLVAALLISGLVNGQVGEGAQTPQSQAGTNPFRQLILSGGPVIDPTSPGAGPVDPPPDVALTFDDGPDPVDRGHPRRAAVPAGAGHLLRGRRTGRRAPGPDAADVRGRPRGRSAHLHPRERCQRDAVAAPARARPDPAGHRRRHRGHHQPAAAPVHAPRSTPSGRRTGRRSSGPDNYRVVYTDLDTEDWARPGVDAIVEQACRRRPAARSSCCTTAAGTGPDCGRARSADHRAEARGYIFNTVTLGGRPVLATGIPRPRPATAGRRLVSVAVRSAGWLTGAVKVAFLAARPRCRPAQLLLLAARPPARPGRSAGPLRRRWHCRRSRSIVPAYNEEVGHRRARSAPWWRATTPTSR